MPELLKSPKKAGFLIKPNSPYLRDTFLEIKDKFQKRGIEVLLAKNSAEMISYNQNVYSFDKMCNESDFLVSLGGDGTLLSLVRRSYKYHKPVLGINAGNLGFLADITIEEVDKFLDEFLRGDYRVDHRLMISGYIERSTGLKIEFFALNDIVITSSIPTKMVVINAYINKEKFNSYRGDGVIISTPTGSTAYNLAAGGPVVYPLTKAFIITPLLAHSLTNQRPLVIPSDFCVEFDTAGYDSIVSVDGQERYEIEEGDIVKICSAKEGAKLIHRKERNYFAVLRDKLHWGDISW